MPITLTPIRNLTNREVDQVNSTLSRMRQRGMTGKNTLSVSRITVSPTSISLTVYAHNSQTSNQLIGSIKGSLGKSLGISGLF